MEDDEIAQYRHLTIQQQKKTAMSYAHFISNKNLL